MPPARAESKSATTLTEVLARPHDYRGAFLLIVPGNLTLHHLARRDEATPFLSIAPAAAGHLGPWVPLGPLNAAAGAAERALGRRLHAFHLEAATLLPCRAGTGPCAVWEAATGRVVVDVGMAAKAAGMGQGLANLVDGFTERLMPALAEGAEMLGAPGGPPAVRKLATLLAKGAAAAITLLIAGKLPAWFCIACPTVLGE